MLWLWKAGCCSILWGKQDVLQGFVQKSCRNTCPDCQNGLSAIISDSLATIGHCWKGITNCHHRSVTNSPIHHGNFSKNNMSVKAANKQPIVVDEWPTSKQSNGMHRKVACVPTVPHASISNESLHPLCAPQSPLLKPSAQGNCVFVCALILFSLASISKSQLH